MAVDAAMHVGALPLSHLCRLSQPAAAGSSADAGAAATLAAKDEELQRLRDENEGLREALASLATSCMPEELREGGHEGGRGEGVGLSA
jgi:hypothetical protein